MHLEAYAASDVGPVRETNEDCWWSDVDERLFVVADGMGGHAAGEVASRIAVDTIRDVMVRRDDPDETILQREVGDAAETLRERLRYAMNRASLRIRKAVEEEPAYTGMGTTLVVLVFDGDQAHLAHVGDSRAYLYRRGRLTRLTRDHTVVQQEVDAGRLTPELARIAPHKNILTRSVGYHGPVEPDTSTRPAEPGDIFLLCSDGLTDALDDSQIAEIMGQHDPEDLPEALIEAAKEHGAEDNITALVVVVSEGDAD